MDEKLRTPRTVTVAELAERDMYPFTTEAQQKQVQALGRYTLTNHIEGYPGPYPVAVILQRWDTAS